MTKRAGAAPGLLLALAVFGAWRVSAQLRTTSEPAPVPAETVLENALANFYADGYGRVRLTNYHGKRKEIERVLEIWTRGQHVFGRFMQPEDIHGTAFLILPPPQKGSTSSDSVRDNQYFIYLPAYGRVRRISGAQRADPFFGTYLSQGDLEAHTASDFTIAAMKEGELVGEAVYELSVTPRFDAGYERAVVTVAKQDYAPLRIEEYNKGSKTPIRVIDAQRAWMQRLSGHVVADKLTVSEGGTDSYTEVVFSERNLSVNFPNSMFTTDYLLRGGD
jgi:hypothetical protein